jgi:hypothetical protein
MEEINDFLEIAIEAGLLSEVVLAALEEMKSDPSIEPVEALERGIIECDCE